MKFITFIIAIICFNTNWGQIEYRPLPETDATWIQAEFLYGGAHEHETVTSAVYTLGDSVINGQNYISFGSHGLIDWMNGFGSQNSTSGTDTIPYGVGFFRQDIAQKKVFQWNQTNQTDGLLYDFGSLVIGQPYPETINNFNYPNLLVMAQDSVQLMDGNYYKRWVLGTNSSDSAYVSVIEGVGGTNGFNTPIYPVFEQSSDLLCHKVSAQHIYENWQGGFMPPRYSEDCSRTLSIHGQEKTNFSIYPNPTSGIVSIQSDQAVKRIGIYSLNGQSLIQQDISSNTKTSDIDLSDLDQGIYLLKIELNNGSQTMEQVQLIK